MKKHFFLFLGFLFLYIFILSNPIFSDKGINMFVNIIYGVATGYHLGKFMNYKE
jgi:hypothetical protein